MRDLVLPTLKGQLRKIYDLKATAVTGRTKHALSEVEGRSMSGKMTNEKLCTYNS